MYPRASRDQHGDAEGSKFVRCIFSEIGSCEASEPAKKVGAEKAQSRSLHKANTSALRNQLSVVDAPRESHVVFPVASLQCWMCEAMDCQRRDHGDLHKCVLFLRAHLSRSTEASEERLFDFRFLFFDKSRTCCTRTSQNLIETPRVNCCRREANFAYGLRSSKILVSSPRRLQNPEIAPSAFCRMSLCQPSVYSRFWSW